MKQLSRIIIIAIVIVFTASILSSCKPADEDIDRGAFEYRNYGIRYDDVGFERTPIDMEIAQGEDDIEAILHILDVIEANLIAADYLASASVGGGSASSSMFDMRGSLDFADIYCRDNGAFYSQSIARVTEASSSVSDSILGAAQAMGQADRKYSADGETFYVQKVKGNKANAKMIRDYPFGTSTFNKGDLEKLSLSKYKEKEYIRSDYRELTNFVINRDTIKADTAEISYEEGMFTLYFEIDLENKEARDTATEYARANMREASSSNDLEYAIYNVTIEVYDNGLIRKYTKEESWEATLKILFWSPHGASLSETSVYYSWDPADCSFSANGIDVSWAK